MFIIAADVGGTKTRMVSATVDEPDRVLHEERYQSAEFDGFETLLQNFMRDSGLSETQLDTLSLALPGLVNGASAKLTNLPWTIEKQTLKDTFGFSHVFFMNDFQASVFGSRVLLEQDKIVLNKGLPDNSATMVSVGAGTGLGMAWFQNDVAYSTEGGHIDFAPIDDRQIELLKFLLKRHEHVSYERLLSGSGLVSLYEFFDGKRNEVTAEWVNAHASQDESADKALSLFVQIYGAYVGNLALLYKPYGGIYIAGGIAPKMVKRMQSPDFTNACFDKGRMRKQVEEIPVYLVTNERVGVMGAMSEAIKLKRVEL